MKGGRLNGPWKGESKVDMVFQLGNGPKKEVFVGRNEAVELIVLQADLPTKFSL
jgi:hypothetical protein